MQGISDLTQTINLIKYISFGFGAIWRRPAYPKLNLIFIAIYLNILKFIL